MGYIIQKGCDLIRVQVCDSIMGSGKSMSAIRYINETDRKFIYLSPYLEEGKRIKDACPDKDFKEPCSDADTTKLQDLHKLLRDGENVVSTHALFKCFNETTINLVKAGDYELVLDEALNVIEVLELSAYDRNTLIQSDYITVAEDNTVQWNESKYEGNFTALKKAMQNGKVTYFKDSVFIWEFPIEAFKAFTKITVLTYLFSSQVLAYYLQLHNIPYEFIGVKKNASGHQFCNIDDPECITKIQNLGELINIVERKKYNAIGEKNTALSVSWYNKLSTTDRLKMRKLIRNVFVSAMKAKSTETLWTMFLSAKDDMIDDNYFGYKKSFLSCSIRATNRYKDRDKLAYCINVFMNPMLKNYIADHGVTVSLNGYALSEMIQWIWRSAIRDGKPIQVFVPSRRMRNLLTDWIAEVSS